MKFKLIPIICILVGCANPQFNECSSEPAILTTSAPVYPMPLGTTADLHTCHEGYVRLQYIISISGEVISPEVIDSKLMKGCTNQSTKNDFFHQAVLDAIIKFKYQPLPKPCITKHRFTFKNE